MKRSVVCMMGVFIVVGVVAAACTQAAPTPAPTGAPAAPAKAGQATAAVAAQPTSSPAQPTSPPAKKVEFPIKGKAISIIVPYAAGGSTDVQARLLAAMMEKDLGVPVEVVDREGSGGQVGITELARAKPDGHTIGYTLLPGVPAMYLNPERGAAFGRKDLQPLVAETLDPEAVVVASSSPYKTLKDLIDAAQASPGKIKVGVASILGDGHVGTLMLQKAAGVRFAIANMTGAAPTITAVLGGQLDVSIQSLPNYTSQLKSGNLRVLAVLDKVESPFVPGVRTAEAQGYKAYDASTKGISVPGGTPKEIVDILAGVLKKEINDEAHLIKLKEMNTNVRFMDSSEFSAYWDEVDSTVKLLVPEVLTK